MTESFVHGVGAVFSADIAVPEYEREVRFYSRVLSTGDKPLWCEKDLMNNFGMPIIGLGPRSDEYAQLPLQWMPHIQVADVAGTVQRALDLGGSSLRHQKDDDGESQWAVKAIEADDGDDAYALVQDTVGAVLALAAS